MAGALPAGTTAIIIRCHAMALMSWHFLLLNCHVWKPNQIVFNLFRNQTMVSDFSFCLLFPHFQRFSIQTCLDKEVWGKKLLLHAIWNVSGCSAKMKLSRVASPAFSLLCKLNHSGINQKEGLLWVNTAGTGCPRWPGYTVFPWTHSWARFLSIYFALLWLLISAMTNNSSEKEISNTF